MHTNTLPIHLEIDTQCSRSAVRAATLQAKHPITKYMVKCASRKVHRHKSPLHLLAATYKADPRSIEMIPTVTRDPTKVGQVPFKIEIAESKEEAKAKDLENRADLQVYMDRSTHGGNVGAAAVMMCKGKKIRSLRYRLGMDDEHTVFEAEVVGILLGLHLIKSKARSKTSVTLGVDNQAILKVLKSKLNKAGHYLAAEIIKLAATIQKKKGKGFTLTLNWTAGHVRIEGNKEVDKEVKKAADGDTTSEGMLPTSLIKKLKRSKLATNQKLSEERKRKWRQEWSALPRYQKITHLDPSLPSKKFVAITSNAKISRSMASKIFQLRAGHIPLNGYLHKIKRAPSAECPECGHPKEMPQHFVMECPVFEKERKKMLPRNRRARETYTKILMEEKRLYELAVYIKEMARFEMGEEKDRRRGLRAGRQEEADQREGED